MSLAGIWTHDLRGTKPMCNLDTNWNWLWNVFKVGINSASETDPEENDYEESLASESEEDSYDEDKEPKTIEELKLKAYNLADKKEIKKKIERERALEPRGKNRNPKQVCVALLWHIILLKFIKTPKQTAIWYQQSPLGYLVVCYV